MCESPDAKSVTSWPASTSPSASSQTTTRCRRSRSAAPQTKTGLRIAILHAGLTVRCRLLDPQRPRPARRRDARRRSEPAQTGSSAARRPSSWRPRSAWRPSRSCSRSIGVPRPRPAAARQSGTDRERRVRRAVCPRDLRQLVIESDAGGEHPPHDALRLRPAAVTGEPAAQQRIVVGPDRAVVVRERVVGGVPLRHRPDAPARPQRVAHQSGRRPLDPLGRDDAAPEQVADVRAASRPAACRRPARARSSRLARRPVGLVEALAVAQRPRARAARPARGRARPHGRARRSAAWRRRRSPAPRTARSAARDPAVGETLRVALVLPGLVVEAASRASLVLDEAVAVEIALVVDRRQRRNAGSRKAVDERGVVGPAPDLGEQHEIERRRVDRAVVPLEPRFAAFPCLTSWTIFPGSASSVGFVLVACSSASTSSALRASSGPKQQRLQARDQRVAPKIVMNHGMPAAAASRARPSRIRSDARSATEQPERWCQVVPPRRSCGTRAPGRERFANVQRAPRRSGARPLGRLLVARRRGPTSMRAPSVARRQLDRVRGPGALHARRLREDHLRRGAAVRIDEHELTSPHRTSARRAVAAAARQRIAQREVVRP